MLDNKQNQDKLLMRLEKMEKMQGSQRDEDDRRNSNFGLNRG